jgi:hypothetical protein
MMNPATTRQNCSFDCVLYWHSGLVFVSFILVFVSAAQLPHALTAVHFVSMQSAFQFQFVVLGARDVARSSCRGTLAAACHFRDVVDKDPPPY